MNAPNSLLVQAITLQNQGREDEAAALFLKCLEANANDVAAIYSLGVIYLKRRQAGDIVGLLEHGSRAAPKFAPVWFALGEAYKELGRRDEALAAYDNALAVKPDYTEVLNNSGALLREMHRHHDALVRFNQVLSINPDDQSALVNCGILLTEFKSSKEAIGMFERLLKLNPDYDYGLGLLCYERLHACDWEGFAEAVQRITEGVRAGKRVCKSLAFMAISDSAADHQHCVRTFAQHFFPMGQQPLWRGERYRHKKIRVAYVSPDLREHPVGHLIAGVIERHDKSRFETVGISLGIDDQSRLRSRFINAFDRFIDVRTLGNRQVAELMREMEIDIAVDLAGYTSDSRTEIFTHRPAPVHVNFLGYPGTMGSACMDYILADPHVIPPEHQGYYDEKVVYLPDAYLPTDAGVKISENTPSRAECGLPEEGVVFCSFSHDYKISPPVFDVWMRLLKQVPGSVLWLMSRSEASQRNLGLEAQARGVDPARLVFAKRVPLVEDHLARYRQADLFLDTHPYNAHTTAADALMAGLPVVTYMGGAFPARVAGSLLHAIGLPELAADSLEGYEALALRLALDDGARAELRARLAKNKETHPLFDTDGFCRHLEAAYVSMWRATQLGQQRDALS